MLRRKILDMMVSWFGAVWETPGAGREPEVRLIIKLDISDGEPMSTRRFKGKMVKIRPDRPSIKAYYLRTKKDSGNPPT
jgi:hypothetical protein